VAFRHGKAGAFWLGTNNLSTFCDQLDLSIDVDTSDTSTFGVGWKTAITGLIGGTLSLSGSYDPTVTTGPAAVLLTAIANGTAWAFSHFPGGSVTGQRSNVGSCFVTNYSESSPVADKVTFSAELLVTGTVTSSTL